MRSLDTYELGDKIWLITPYLIKVFDEKDLNDKKNDK